MRHSSAVTIRAGGAKNFLGHSKRSHHNLYVYPDAKPIEGAGPGLTGFAACATSDGNKKGSSGWGEAFDHNRCVLQFVRPPRIRIRRIDHERRLACIRPKSYHLEAVPLMYVAT